MQDHYLQPEGFLGTGASLLADATLIAYLFLIIPAMLAGFVFARRQLFRPYHKWTMVTITAINWLLIIFLMAVAFFYDVSDNIAEQPGNGRYLFPAIHAGLGLVAQGMATYLVLRMLNEERQIGAAKRRGETDFTRYYVNKIKLPMRITLGLWLATAMLGILSYMTRYEVIGTFNTTRAEPIVTEEPATTAEPGDAPIIGTPEPDIIATEAPATTPEPASTPEPDFTPEPDDTPEPDETPEPDFTPEPDETPEPGT